MTWRRDQLDENRHLRDAARALVEADLKNLRADLSIKTIGERALDRLTETAGEACEEAIEVASENKGIIAAILAALLLWFAREPIQEALFGDGEE